MVSAGWFAPAEFSAAAAESQLSIITANKTIFFGITSLPRMLLSRCCEAYSKKGTERRFTSCAFPCSAINVGQEAQARRNAQHRAVRASAACLQRFRR